MKRKGEKRQTKTHKMYSKTCAKDASEPKLRRVPAGMRGDTIQRVWPNTKEDSTGSSLGCDSSLHSRNCSYDVHIVSRMKVRHQRCIAVFTKRSGERCKQSAIHVADTN